MCVAEIDGLGTAFGMLAASVTCQLLLPQMRFRWKRSHAVSLRSPKDDADNSYGHHLNAECRNRRTPTQSFRTPAEAHQQG
jgi:hypothetical protein